MTVLALMLMFLIAPAGQLGTAVSNTVIKGGVIKGGSSTPVCAPVSILNVCIIPPQSWCSMCLSAWAKGARPVTLCQLMKVLRQLLLVELQMTFTDVQKILHSRMEYTY